MALALLRSNLRPYEVSTVLMNRVYRGLCSTCSNSVICTYARETGRPVTGCEEFEGYTMTRPISCGGFLSPLARSWVRPEEEVYSGAAGLCGTCAARATCTGEPTQSTCSNYR